MDRVLTKEELEAQIDHKQRRLEEDFETTSTEIRERLGSAIKVTIPVALALIGGAGLLIRRLSIRRMRTDLTKEFEERAASARRFDRLSPLSLAYGALLLGAGVLLGRRRPRVLVEPSGRTSF